VVPQVFVARFLGDEREGAAGLEPALVDVGERGDSLAPGRRLELVHRDQLALEMMAEETAVSNERVRPAFDRVELAVVVERAYDERVDRQQRRRADDAPEQRIVIADDRVLHRVREQQQHDEVERVELRQLAFPRDAQSDEEKDVDDDRADQLLDERNAGHDEGRPHVEGGRGR